MSTSKTAPSSKPQKAHVASNNIFQTQPNVASQPRSTSHNAYSNQPMYKSILGKPPSLSRSPYSGHIQNPHYRDPPAKLTEGVFRKLYEPMTATHFYSPQVTPRVYQQDGYDQVNMSQSNANLRYVQGEITRNTTDFGYDRTPKQMVQVDGNPHYRSSPRVSPPMRDYPPQEAYMSYPVQRREPEFQQRPNPQYERVDALEEEYQNYQDRRREEKVKGPTYPPYAENKTMHPTLQDSAKMRNPLYMSYDFSKVDNTNDFNRSRYRPNGYNYVLADPVAPKEFLKSHVATVAHAKKYDMEQKMKVHPQLGMLGVLEGERKSTPILKEYASEGQTNPLNTFPKDQFSATRRQSFGSTKHEVNPMKGNVGYSVDPKSYYEPRDSHFRAMMADTQGFNRQEDKLKSTFSSRGQQGGYGQTGMRYGQTINYPW